MLTVNHITKTFEQQVVLRDVSLSVGTGEIYGLIGKNGAGKTTLMNIISGLIKQDTGTCLVSREGNQKSSIGYLPDIPSFYAFLTAQEYLDFLLMDPKGKNEQGKSLLNLVGLHGNEKIHAMSRGMKQRLGVAAALVRNPGVLLLDEPSSALDPVGRHELMDILSRLKAEGCTIILSTHILTDMEKICDKVGFLQDGVIQKEICVKDLRRGKQDVWRIAFEAELPAAFQIDPLLKIRRAADCCYVFQTTDQKYLLRYLAGLPVKIVSIQNQTISLDELFSEVCG